MQLVATTNYNNKLREESEQASEKFEKEPQGHDVVVSHAHDQSIHNLVRNLLKKEKRTRRGSLTNTEEVGQEGGQNNGGAQIKTK